MIKIGDCVKKSDKYVKGMRLFLINIFTYIRNIHETNFNILVDKEFKINGFTEMSEPGSSFTMNNGFNLSHNIIGCHIGVIIPDILSLLEYKYVLEKIFLVFSSGEIIVNENLNESEESIINNIEEEKVNNFNINYIAGLCNVQDRLKISKSIFRKGKNRAVPNFFDIKILFYEF